jgi:hypothetical protein
VRDKFSRLSPPKPACYRAPVRTHGNASAGNLSRRNRRLARGDAGDFRLSGARHAPHDHRPDTQAQGPLHHSSPEQRRGHPRWRTFHARPTQELGRGETAAGRAAPRTRRHRSEGRGRGVGCLHRVPTGPGLPRPLRSGARDQLSRLSAAQARPRRHDAPAGILPPRRQRGCLLAGRLAPAQDGGRPRRTLLRIPQARPPPRRAAEQPQGRRLLPRQLRARCPRPRGGGGRPPRPHRRAHCFGRGAGHEVRGGQGRALLPLHARADALLRRLLRVGAVAQAAAWWGERPREPASAGRKTRNGSRGRSPHRAIRLEGRRVDAPCPDDKSPLRAGRHADEARASGPRGSAGLDRRRAQPRGRSMSR